MGIILRGNTTGCNRSKEEDESRGETRKVSAWRAYAGFHYAGIISLLHVIAKLALKLSKSGLIALTALTA